MQFTASSDTHEHLAQGIYAGLVAITTVIGRHNCDAMTYTGYYVHIH